MRKLSGIHTNQFQTRRNVLWDKDLKTFLYQLQPSIYWSFRLADEPSTEHETENGENNILKTTVEISWNIYPEMTPSSPVSLFFTTQAL